MTTASIDFRGDPARIKWSKRVGDSCAYCGARNDGTGAQFCDPCAHICFGLSFPDEYEGER